MDGGKDEGSIERSRRVPRGRKNTEIPHPRPRLVNPGTWADLIAMHEGKVLLNRVLSRRDACMQGMGASRVSRGWMAG